MSRGAALLVLGALAGASACPPARADEPRRFALVVGEPDGGPGALRLRYAERDARRIHAILTWVGGVRPEDARLLLSTGASAFLSALADLSARAEAARAQGVSTVLLVYYSGHAADGALRLGSERIPFEQLRLALERAPAAVRIGLLDSCRSGAIARAKGVRPAPTVDVQHPAGEAPRGLVLIASSAADEDSQESDAIGASWFTHHLASGLLGGADSSGDGKVTLSEAYAYAYARTVGSTASSAPAPRGLRELLHRGPPVLRGAPDPGGPPARHPRPVVRAGGPGHPATRRRPGGRGRRRGLRGGRGGGLALREAHRGRLERRDRVPGGLVDTVRAATPTWRERDARGWGPWRDPEHSGAELRASLVRSFPEGGGAARAFTYVLEARATGAETWTTVLEGQLRGGSATRGTGSRRSGSPSPARPWPGR